MALDGNDAFVLGAYGGVLMFSLGRRVDALAMFDRAIEFNPNLVVVWILRGMCKGGLGREAEAISDYEHALRLSPRDPNRWIAEHGLAWRHLMGGRYDEATSHATTVLQLHPSYGPTLRVVIAADALAGRLGAAREMLARHMAMEPQMRISTMREPYLRRIRIEEFDRLVDGLRKAGFPE